MGQAENVAVMGCKCANPKVAEFKVIRRRWCVGCGYERAYAGVVGDSPSVVVPADGAASIERVYQAARQSSFARGVLLSRSQFAAAPCPSVLSLEMVMVLVLAGFPVAGVATSEISPARTKPPILS